MFSKIQTNENINGDGKPNLRLIVEVHSSIMQRLSFNSIGHAYTFNWCDWIRKRNVLYTICPTLFSLSDNIERDEMFSKIQTNENINGDGEPNLRLNVEMFNQINAKVLDLHGQNIKEIQKENLMENILKTPGRRNINEEIFPKDKDMVIRTEYLKTILRIRIQEEETLKAIQGLSYLIDEIDAQCIRECEWKISFVHMLKDANLSGKFLELPSSETTAYQQEQQSKGKSINTETDIQEEDIKKIRNRTMRTKEKASNLNELTEITGSRIDNNGVLKEYKNGNEEYGKLEKSCRKKPFPKAPIKRRHKKAIKSIKPTKPYVMLLHGFVAICSLGKCLSTMQKVALCFCMCVICHVMGLNRACLASISTKKIVQECPKSVEDFTKRAYEMNCHQIPQNCTSPNNFQYHCLPTEDRNIFVDVCAEVKYISCHCAMYDTTAGIVQNDDNTLFKGTLENCTYRSNTFHAECHRGIFVAFNSTEEFVNISMKYPANFENKKTASTNMDSAAVVAVVVICVVIIAVIITVLGCLMQRSAAKRRHPSAIFRDNNEEFPNNQDLENRLIEEEQRLHRL